MPRELAGDVSRLTVTGDRRVHIDRHGGVTEYDEGLVAVASGGGTIRFLGRGMSLAAMNGEELLIEGELERIEFVRR
ncbi:MAG: YabP/YqfC family sporulation protein [Oscillospiraceae bacterium]|jgi:sporulation protein YqfC|nr:YabP/YqfC family sporulation protein [Oscillospiraceae bacterium]